MIEDLIGRKAIIRARDAGVHYGTVVSITGRTVVLRNARRIWRWRGAMTLSDLATSSTPALCPDHTRIAPKVKRLAVLDACEVICTTKGAQSRIKKVKPWRA